MANFRDPRINAVLSFWFGPNPASPRPQWFKTDPAFDRAITQLFATDYERARAGDLHAWDASPPGALALTILLDQFPRNMFRDSPRAFESDGIALDGARRMTAMHWDDRLNAHERQFAYLPFEHAEQLEAQKASMFHFGRLADEHGSHDLLEWARKHYVIVERFGRFPHRNAVLGRAPTPEETEFLQGPDSRF